MKHLNGLDMRDAAKGLHTTEFALRKHLATMGAIRKTDLGWVASPKYHERGLLKTATRQHTLKSETGARIRKNYTVVVITGDGLSWLSDNINTEIKQ